MADGDMTLALDQEALARLAGPAAAVRDAREWASHVVLTGENPREVTAFARRHGVDRELPVGRGVRGTLGVARERFDTERHVYVGPDQRGRSVASALGWEYLTVEEAAEKAGWERESEPAAQTGVRGRLGRLVARLVDAVR